MQGQASDRNSVSLGADYVLHAPRVGIKQQKPATRPNPKQRVSGLREDIRRIKQHWDKQSLVHRRKPLHSSDDHKVMLARKFRELGYKKQGKRIEILLDDVLDADPTREDSQIDAHVVSSALSAAAKCVTRKDGKDPLFIKGQKLMDKSLDMKIMMTNEFVFSAFFNLCAMSHQPEVALQYFHIMKKKFTLLKPDPFIFSSLLKAFAMAGRMEEAKKIFERAETKFAVLDQRLVSQAIQFFVQNGQVRYGLKMFNDMVSRGLFPSTYDLNVLLSTLCKNTLSKTMLKVLMDLRKEMESNGCRSDAHTFEALLQGCKKAKALEFAVDVFSEIESNIKANHFHLFFEVVVATMNNESMPVGKKSLTKEDRSGLALDVLLQMDKFNLKPSMDTLNVVLEIAMKSELPLKVVLFLRKMHTFGRTPGVSTWLRVVKYAMHRVFGNFLTFLLFQIFGEVIPRCASSSARLHCPF
eukprot:TRINITY_DN1628_c0_g1_i1.p1 TRINITY_DN1628_c0_g1~~TRINITY_DN1628_c0_g1_i1.p1  ORF type:complete len:527 (+),score=117.25 TRINITY_DN1628_c0_g1_i1:179-1582(+)